MDIIIFLSVCALIVLLFRAGEWYRLAQLWKKNKGLIYALREKAALWDRHKKTIEDLNSVVARLKNEKTSVDEKEKSLKLKESAVEILAKERSTGFPWLANAYADFFFLQDSLIAQWLREKASPAKKTARRIEQEIAVKRREAERNFRIAHYQLKYYESLFPWLEELKDPSIDPDLIRTTGSREASQKDPVSNWMPAGEYAKLSESQRNQVALDRYINRKMSAWEIGREYERYVGYLLASKGWKVSFYGIIKGFDDLGRDLIAKKSKETLLVQCKNWSAHSTIHENHIFQFYGTYIAYTEDNPAESVIPKFILTNVISDRAGIFAKRLGIIVEKIPLDRDFPRIKCHISPATKEKIYHLPIDQQYDNTIIEYSQGEFYAKTIKEAEEKGFRRAYRYYGLLLE